MPWIDRTPEPWATRAPYGPGETWPTQASLLNHAERCHPDSLRQARWADAHLTVASPQVVAG